ncbi:hypothetical protein BX666DRAFT_1946624 [Dichotomocladium elegans]|nr:hypothetical protein BX666DRAFT_1946624 [Dichotomocladium elegans]
MQVLCKGRFRYDKMGQARQCQGAADPSIGRLHALTATVSFFHRGFIYSKQKLLH